MSADFTPQFASEEARAAVLVARAAMLNATIAGMHAENVQRAAWGHSPAYDEAAFIAAANASGCHHNDIVTLMIHGCMG